jgi:hypothetical protein
MVKRRDVPVMSMTAGKYKGEFVTKVPSEYLRRVLCALKGLSALAAYDPKWFTPKWLHPMLARRIEVELANRYAEEMRGQRLGSGDGLLQEPPVMPRVDLGRKGRALNGGQAEPDP